MGIPSRSILKFVSVGAAMLGLMALVILAAPAIRGRAQGGATHPNINVHPNISVTHMFGGPELGVSVRDVEQADATREKLQGLYGAVVEDVRRDSAADKAGFKTGDVVVSFDGEKVRSARHLDRLVEETPAGREVTASVIRNGDKVELKVTPATGGPFDRAFDSFLSFNMPNGFAFSAPRGPSGILNGRNFFGMPGRLGVSIQDLSGQLGEYFGTTEGALVTSVEENSAAKTAGIKAGDVITKINGQPVHDSASLRSRLAEASGELTITVMRDRKEQTLKGKLQDETPSRRVIRRIVV